MRAETLRMLEQERLDIAAAHCAELVKARAKAERLQAAVTKMAIGVNHIATYKTDQWPAYGARHELALQALGAGREYDMWCCWNAAMCARDELEAA